MIDAWQLAEGVDLRLRRWGDEFVVHHALSNDTYRLGLAGGLVLETLADADVPLTAAALASPGLPQAAVEEALEALAELGFVSPC
jgi:hypothetical protein